MTATGQNVAAPPPNFMTVVVARRVVMARDTISLYLVAPGTQHAPAPYQPGQFVTLAMRTPNEFVYRSYSLSSAGRSDQPWEITIKRQGTVSAFLFDKITAGTTLYVSAPRGTFTLPPQVRADVPLIFVAAGSGITPIMGMLRTLALLPAGQRPHVQLHYGSRSLDDIIYRRELERMDPSKTWLHQWHYLSKTGFRISAEHVLARAGADANRAHWYVCGPESLSRQLQTLLTQRGVPSTNLHSEVFATQSGQATATASLHAVAGTPRARYLRIQQTGVMLDARPRETLLTALERQGYHPDFSCRVGTCGTCKLRVLAGRVAPVGDALTNAERAAGYVLSCVAVPQTDVTLLSGGRPPAGGAVARGGFAPAAQRAASKTLLRVACLAMMGGVVGGAWNLTDHRPDSWQVGAAAPTATPTHKPAPTRKPAPTATPSNGFNGYPTDTPVAGGGGGDFPTATPQPTDTPQPQPTATPKPPPPAPTATTRPSGR